MRWFPFLRICFIYRSVEEQEFLSLGHLLGTSIYPELTGHSSTQSHDQRDPQTQSGHNQLTDRVQQRSNSLSSVSHLPNQADPVSRLRLQTQGVALSDSGDLIMQPYQLEAAVSAFE